jgi:hypothetical protein
MANLYSKKEIRLAKKAIRLDKSKRFTLYERDRSMSSLDKLYGVKKDGSKAKKIIKSSGLARSDRRGMIKILNGKDSKNSGKNASFDNKPKTSWWKAVSGGSKSQGSSSAGGSDLSSVRSRPGSPSFTSSSGSGSSRPGFTSNRGDSLGGPSNTSDRRSSTTSSRPHISLKS